MSLVVDISLCEKTLLSSMISFKAAFDECARALKKEHFTNEANAEIYAVMKQMRSEGLELDAPSVMLRLNEALKRAFMDICLIEPTNNYKLYLNELSKQFLLKKQRELALSLERASADNQVFSLDELLASFEEAPKAFKTFWQWANDESFKQETKKYKTGVKFIDGLLDGGIALGQLVLLSGEPEAGKTSLGVQILEYLSFVQKTAFFCFEFTIEQYIRAKQNSESSFTNSGGKNLFIINEEYSIDSVASNIRHLYKTHKVKFFLIDSQMRLETHKARSLEEEETTKFSVLAKLAHSLNIVIFFIVQTSKTDTQNPSGTKKGAHEASICLKIEHIREKNSEVFHPCKRKLTIWKNKQNGKHNVATLAFEPLTRQFKDEIIEEHEFKS